jgi:hypothetical protein
MTDENNGTPPPAQKAHLNQNLVIAIIGAVATVMAAVIPWVLDRTAQSPTPTAIQATFTVAAPTETTDLVEAAPTHTEIPASPTSEPTITATPTQEAGINNVYMAFDFDGKFIETSFKGGQTIYVFFNINDPLGRNIVRVIVSAVDVPGVLVDSQFYNTINEYPNPDVSIVVSQGGLKPGKYKVDIILNNTLAETLEFTVTE